MSLSSRKKEPEGQVGQALPLRGEYTIGMERVLASLGAKLALKKTSEIFPKLPHGSPNALDLSLQIQSFGPTEMSSVDPCELECNIRNAGMGKAVFYWLFPPVVFTICFFNCINKGK